MSHSKVPTIPFVLPLYHKMEKHLKVVSTSCEHSYKTQHAAEQGLAKLRKYAIPAKLRHSYIVGTGKSLHHSLNPTCELRCYILIVLHPCLHSHWFAATVDPDDAAAQDDMISTPKAIFKYIAETYLKVLVLAPAVAPQPTVKPVAKTSSFLTSACLFQQPTTATKTTTILKHTPQEELANELAQYFSFEAAPMEMQKGEERKSDKPSAQEVLLNPLLWWKVSSIFSTHNFLTTQCSGTCHQISYYCSDGSGLSCYTCNQCLH